MILRATKGYAEGQDITKLPMEYLTYPSKNCLIYKGTAYSRPGIVNDGVAATTTDKKILGEFVWKDALGGEKALRVTDTKVQLKWNGLWITIFSSLTSGALRVRFATWIDSTGTIIKKRLFFVDGSDKIYEWNGAVGTIASVNSGAQTLTVSGSSTLLQLGFDSGASVVKAVRIIRFSGGAVAGTDDYTTDDDMTDAVMHLTSAFTTVPVAGDLVIAAVVVNTTILAGVDKDDIYTYKNKLAVANLDSIRVYFSHTSTKLDFVIPGSPTAASPFFVDLPGNYTAMIARFNQSTQQSILWISDVDGWTKVISLDDANSFGFFRDTERIAQTERNGALPFAVADYKGDIIFFGQDRTLQRVTTLDVLGTDELRLISDNVDALLKRVDVAEVRLYFLSRYIEMCLPAEGLLLMLDMIEEQWQPPQTIGISHLSVIAGIQYGHSNTRDETFQMFTGRNDLDTKIQSIFAFPYYAGEAGQEFRPKKHTRMGVAGRMTASTVATVEQFFETDGAKATDTFQLDGSEIKLYTVADDQSWATHIFGDASTGGADAEASPLGRFFVFEEYNGVSWFEWRPVITVNGDEQEFHLLGLSIEESLSKEAIPADLFVPK